jgi:serine/threonine protein kinase
VRLPASQKCFKKRCDALPNTYENLYIAPGTLFPLILLSRFQCEAKAIAKLSHPHILPVYDFGQQDNLTYIVMQYIEAGTFRDMLGEPLGLNRATEIIAPVAEAPDYAHEQGVIHRDVKPGNVLMERGQRALLTDLVGEDGGRP